jgi:hypothetical protein
MALKRFSGGGTGGTTEAEDEDLTNEEVVRQAKRRQRETDAEADRATRDAQQDTGDMVDASGLTLDDLGLPGGSSGPLDPRGRAVEEAVRRAAVAVAPARRAAGRRRAT